MCFLIIDFSYALLDISYYLIQKIAQIIGWMDGWWFAPLSSVCDLYSLRRAVYCRGVVSNVTDVFDHSDGPCCWGVVGGGGKSFTVLVV